MTTDLFKELLGPVLKDTVVPETLRFIKSRLASGNFPTEQEVFDHLATHADTVSAASDAFLARKHESQSAAAKPVAPVTAPAAGAPVANGPGTVLLNPPDPRG